MEDKMTVDEKYASVSSRIAELEREKLEVKRQIEQIMQEMADEVGKKTLKRAKYKVGEAPNDWFVGSDE